MPFQSTRNSPRCQRLRGNSSPPGIGWREKEECLLAATGTIVTRVFTSRAQIPVEGATVAFTQRGEGGRHALLALRVTDGSGRTAPVQVATPDQAASAFPGTPDPFAVCDIWVESPGYELLVVENVQIFPGTETLQELELVPLPERTDPLLPEHPVNIPAQTL